jgi:hypothetical protein
MQMRTNEILLGILMAAVIGATMAMFADAIITRGTIAESQPITEQTSVPTRKEEREREEWHPASTSR